MNDKTFLTHVRNIAQFVVTEQVQKEFGRKDWIQNAQKLIEEADRRSAELDDEGDGDLVASEA